MRNLKKELENKKINYEILTEKGFRKQKAKYLFEKNICDNSFKVVIEISKEKKVSKVVDLLTNEEYILVDTKSSGSFVGKIKSEYEKIIASIIKECTTSNVFKNKKSQKIIKYIKEKYDSELEYLWDKYPDCAIYRHKKNNKWYGLLMKIKASSIGLASNKKIEILNLKYQKENISDIIDYKNIYPGYHMNKNNWITINLEEQIDIKQIKSLIDNSYELSNSVNKKS